MGTDRYLILKVLHCRHQRPFPAVAQTTRKRPASAAMMPGAQSTGTTAARPTDAIMHKPATSNRERLF